MRFQWLLSFMAAVVLAACGSSSSVVPTITVAPVATARPLAPTALPPTSAAVPPTNVPVPTPTPTVTLAATSAVTPTSAPRATNPRPTATSSGPLAATIYVASCRSAPTADKPGRVIVQISIEASGGNGQYRYFYQDQAFPAKFIEISGEKGTRTIGEVRVTSGDGQELKKEFDIGIGGLNCP